jgi:hypothetical protein
LLRRFFIGERRTHEMVMAALVPTTPLKVLNIGVAGSSPTIRIWGQPSVRLSPPGKNERWPGKPGHLDSQPSSVGDARVSW